MIANIQICTRYFELENRVSNVGRAMFRCFIIVLAEMSGSFCASVETNCYKCHKHPFICYIIVNTSFSTITFTSPENLENIFSSINCWCNIFLNNN